MDPSLTGWVIAGVISGLLLLALFAPIEAEVALERPLRFSIRARWMGVPLPIPRRRAGPKPSGPKRQGQKREGGALKPKPRGGLIRKVAGGVHAARPAVAVLREPGVPQLIWRKSRRALRLVRVVRADLIVLVGSGMAAKGGLGMALLAMLEPTVFLAGGRLKVMIAPDLLGGVGAEGRLVLRTRAAALLGFGVGILISPVAWRALRVWKRAR